MNKQEQSLLRQQFRAFEVGSIQFTAIRKMHPRPHWVARIEETGEILTSGVAGISNESVPKMIGSIQELLDRVSKGDVADFRRGFGLPKVPPARAQATPAAVLPPGLELVVDGTAPEFTSPATAMEFGKRFASAEFCDTALQALPYLESCRGERLSILAHGVVSNPATGYRELLFFVKSERNPDAEGTYYARALTRISTAAPGAASTGVNSAASAQSEAQTRTVFCVAHKGDVGGVDWFEKEGDRNASPKHARDVQFDLDVPAGASKDEIAHLADDASWTQAYLKGGTCRRTSNVPYAFRASH